MDDSDGPARASAVAFNGPWTFYLVVRVTASCPGCGTSATDSRTGLTLLFDSSDQAREELLRDHGWHYIAWPTRAKGAAALLCPDCAVGMSCARPWPDRLSPGQHPLPANAAVPPPGTSRRRWQPWHG